MMHGQKNIKLVSIIFQHVCLYSCLGYPAREVQAIYSIVTCGLYGPIIFFHFNS